LGAPSTSVPSDASRAPTLEADEKQAREIVPGFGSALQEVLGAEPNPFARAEAGSGLNFRNLDSLRNRVASAKSERIERLRSRGVREEPSLNQASPGGKPRAAVSFLEDGRALIHAMKKPDVEHVAYRNLHAVGSREDLA
jgi:hypothetical protein